MTAPRSPFDLSGKVAVVTGAARGVGRAAAVALAQAGDAARMVSGSTIAATGGDSARITP